jgi:hypothetical protein
MRELFLQKPAFCSHSPDKNGTEGQEKKDPRAAANDSGTDACDKASGIHRMPYVAVRTRCYQFMSFLDGDSLAPISAKMLTRPDLQCHSRNAQNDADAT